MDLSKLVFFASPTGAAHVARALASAPMEGKHRIAASFDDGTQCELLFSGSLSAL